MSYIEDNLMENEEVLHWAYVHPAVFLPSVFAFLSSCVLLVYGILLGSRYSAGSQAGSVIMVLSAMVLCFIAIILAVEALIIKLTTEFAVTNRRVIAKRGFIRRHTLEILLNKVESISVHQDILGRLLDFGTITVTGTGGTMESFRGIAEPLTVRKQINQIVEQYAYSAPQYESPR